MQTIGFDYGQRHNIEMECRINLLKRIQLHSSNFLGKLSNDIVINLEEIKNISESSLLNSENIEMLENGLPNTFVPGRNLIFLNYASIIAYKNKAKNIIGGMCETCLLYTSPSPRDATLSRMPSSA